MGQENRRELPCSAAQGGALGSLQTPDALGSPRPWRAAAAVAVVLVLVWGATLLWTFTWGKGSPGGRRLQPLFVLGLTLAYVLTLRFVAGLRIRAISWRTWALVLSSQVLLAALWSYGTKRGLMSLLGPGLGWTRGQRELIGFTWFSLSRLLLRALVPALLAWKLLGLSWRDLGFSLGRRSRVVWIYLGLTLLMVLAVLFIAAPMKSFQRSYPFCRLLIRSGQMPLGPFLLFQLLYFLVFVSGEAFWRGTLVFGLGKELGGWALLYMIIPYTAIHFGKPLPETLGAAVTGLVLGYLALRKRSFWWGVLAHWAVALTLEFAAIAQRGVSFGPG